MALGVDVEAGESTAGFTRNFAPDSVRFEAGRDLYAGLRFTAAASDRLNLYARAGYSNARAKAILTAPTFAETIEGDFSRHQAVAALGLRF